MKRQLVKITLTLNQVQQLDINIMISNGILLSPRFTATATHNSSDQEEIKVREREVSWNKE